MTRVDGGNSGIFQSVRKIAIFHRLFSLLAEGFQANLEFIFEKSDAFKVFLCLLSLSISTFDFIVIGCDTSDVIKHFASFSGGHGRQKSDVALKDDVVAIATCSGLGKNSPEFSTGGRTLVQIVSRDRIILSIQLDRSSESNLVSIYS